VGGTLYKVRFFHFGYHYFHIGIRTERASCVSPVCVTGVARGTEQVPRDNAGRISLSHRRDIRVSIYRPVVACYYRAHRPSNSH
jgi:hypothetical protein